MSHPHSHRMGYPHGKSFGVRPNLDFDRVLLAMIWETIQAYDLACRHCRVSAQPLCNPNELTTAEGVKFLDGVRKSGHAVSVFSDGDAFRRPDIIDLVQHGAKIGLRMATTPATTSFVSHEQLQMPRDMGLSRLAVNLDGSNTTIHDEFRHVEGGFTHGLRILRETQEIGLTTQVNTVVHKADFDDMEATC